MAADDGVIESRPQFERLLLGRALQGRQVRGVSMPQGAWHGASLAEVRFERCTLEGLDTDACELLANTWHQVDLRHAGLVDAYAARCRWHLCDATESRFARALLVDCEFDDSRLSRACFDGATLRRCRFTRSELASASFRGARLVQTEFVGYRGGLESLTRVDFGDAFLSQVSLAGVNLYGAHLVGATLIGCDLTGANLCAANLAGARFVGCRLQGIELDHATIL